MSIPSEFQSSKALQYVISKGFNWRQADSERVELERCPLCKKENYGHFYIKVDGSKQDGLWACHKCGESGHLTSLKEELGDKNPMVSDGLSKGEAELMPDIQKMHEDLLADEGAMEYLVNERGFSIEIIKQQRLGVSKRYYKKLGGEIKSLSYPYLVSGNCVFVHWRTLPPANKEFSSIKGWEAPLYNGEIIKDGLKEITFVEGEANTIISLQHGILNIAGVPGANFKKAMWIEELDKLELEKIYICYDKDKVGQKAAQVLASRIGINRCYKVVLPDFDVPNEDGTTRLGKDLNEWFRYGGGTSAAWDKLKADAQKFDVDGVTGLSEGLDNFEDELNGKESLMPKYMMPWNELNGLLGLEEGDILDIIAFEKIGKTTFGLNLMEWFVNQYDEDGIIICLEMPNERMIRKWVSHVAQVADKVTFEIEEAKVLKESMLAGVKVARLKHQNRKGNLYFCYPKGLKTLDEFFKLLEDCIRRYGVRWIMVDNLQLLAGHTPRGNKNRMEHIDAISKGLQKTTKDYGVNMLRIVQPHRGRDGELCTTDDADGAASIMKDCDAAISLNRAKKPPMSMDALKTEGMDMGADASFDRVLLVTVGLSRYSSGGQCKLDYVGETSTVREYNGAQIKAEEVAKNSAMKGANAATNTDPGGDAGVSSSNDI